ncbi:MAG: hypothetical protein DLM55_09310 [Acidimicrobiales bacterium]|nr:MAG: hypothetical protein DLM55_09310 [Acidimicrobiales bacterium]
MKDLLLLPTGVLVGIVNAVAGGGGLLSFPMMIALGYSPFTANITVTAGALPGNISSAWGHRVPFVGEKRSPSLALGVSGIVGALGGCTLLLLGGAATFTTVVPWLLVTSALLVLAQPQIVRAVRHLSGTPGAPKWLGVLGAAVVSGYGGYFGVAMGVMFLGVFGVLIHEPWQQLNAWKNEIAVFVNTTAVIVFALFAHIAWSAAVLLALGTFVGGFLGARIARRLPDRWFRLVVASIGLVAAAAVLLH